MKMDDELKSMRSCVSAIEELPLEARARVASYLFERYGDLSLHTESVKRSIEKMEALEKRISQREEEVADLLQQIRTMPITPRDDEPIDPGKHLQEVQAGIESMRGPSLLERAVGRFVGALSEKEQDLLKSRFGIEATPSAGGAEGGSPNEENDPDINDIEEEEGPSVISASVPPPAPEEPDEEGMIEV